MLKKCSQREKNLPKYYKMEKLNKAEIKTQADNLVFQLIFKRLKTFTRCLLPVSIFFGKTPLFFRYSGVNAANAVQLLAKRR